MSDFTKDRKISNLCILCWTLICGLVLLSFFLWQDGRSIAVQHQIIEDLNRDADVYIATMQVIADERDANLAEVMRLQALFTDSQDDRARLLSELAQTQTERDLYRDALNTVIGDYDFLYGPDPLDCWPVTSSPIPCPVPDETPVLDMAEEAIIWCLDTGAAIGGGNFGACVEMYLAGSP